MYHKKKRWRIKDIVDLEYFLHDSANRPDDEQDDNIDRTIFLKHIEPAIREKTLDPDDRRAVLHCWLENRRNLEKESMADHSSFLPGDIFSEARRLLTIVFLIGGLVSGAGLAFSFLIYRGVEPLNVSTYLGTFVLLQLLLVIAALLLFVLRRHTGVLHGRFFLYSLINMLLVKVVKLAAETSRKNISTGQWERTQAVAGLIKGKQQIYGALFYRPLVIIAQICGIGFNLGVLGATLLRVLTADLAFGWQSTIQVGPQVVYHIVKIIALPWSWCLSPPVAYPALEQIEGSRMVLKSGIYYLATPHLVSWWPFLCLAVLFYGLLPRVCFWMGAVLLQEKALRWVQFDTAACDQLMQRMQTPLLKTQSPEAQAGQSAERIVFPQEKTAHVSSASFQAETSAPAFTGAEMRSIVLIPSDIFSMCEDSALQQFVRQTYGYEVWKKMEVELDVTGDQERISRLAETQWPDDPRPRILIILEAWQPPIREILEFLQALRHQLGMSAAIGIALIGRPASNSIFTTAGKQDMVVWRRAITSLGDPGLRLETPGGSYDR